MLTNPGPRIMDRGTPFIPDDSEFCDCHPRRKDGIDDLRLRFKIFEVIHGLNLNMEPSGMSFELVIECQTVGGGAPVRGSDCVKLGRRLGPQYVVCGDGNCDTGETCANCPGDCCP